jgi:hypothetical protein
MLQRRAIDGMGENKYRTFKSPHIAAFVVMEKLNHNKNWANFKLL